MQLAEVRADDPELVAMVTAQQAEVAQRYDENPDHGFAQPPLHADTTWLVLRDDGRALGCAAVQPLSHTLPGAAPDVGEVKRLYVVPGARGRGLSRVLMDAVEDTARGLGYRRLQLETGLAQPEALALYRDLGYLEIAPYGHYKNSPDSACFRKEL